MAGPSRAQAPYPYITGTEKGQTESLIFRRRHDFHETDGAFSRLVTWMQKTLMVGLDEAVREAALWEVDKPREEWLFGYPAELALLAGQVTIATVRPNSVIVGFGQHSDVHLMFYEGLMNHSACF